MSTVHDYLRRYLLDSSGANGGLAQALTDWCPEFVALMRARMVQGFFRYGSARRKEQEKRNDNVKSAIDRLKAYRSDGNQEHLVDAANLCQVEYMTGNCHPNPTFWSVDDGEHAPEVESQALASWEDQREAVRLLRTIPSVEADPGYDLVVLARLACEEVDRAYERAEDAEGKEL